jgi:ammonia channel protein AmtB
MTLPGLALFYGGLVRSKNGINANKVNIFFIPISLQCVLVGFAGANTDHFF